MSPSETTTQWLTWAVVTWTEEVVACIQNLVLNTEGNALCSEEEAEGRDALCQEGREQGPGPAWKRPAGGSLAGR